MSGTLAEKVWDAHVVRRGEGEPDLLYIDLHLLHEVTSPQAFDGLRLAGRKVRRPDLTLATEDHNVPTTPGPITDLVSRTQVETLRRNCEEFGVRLFPMGDAEQGIVHVVGPQLGLTQPGMTIVCGDSHTSTHGAFGALAFGIGTSEVEHVLATQTLPLKPFRTMAINVEGELQTGVTAKDIVLAVIAKIGTGGGQGYVLEYRGSAIRALSMEARMTVCNMSIEAGARAGMIAPDETTFEYLRGRQHAPVGADWDAAVADWAHLRSDDDAVFDAEVDLDASALTPFVTWGTNPGQGAPLSEAVPDPERMADEHDKAAARRALEYMGLEAGHAAARHPGRHRLRRVLHQRPDRGPACRRRRRQGPPGRRRRAHARRARLGARAPAGRGGGPGPGLHRGRRRVAPARLLDVPGHEPRPARAGGAQRLDVQPQLRGTPGQGRPHPPGQPARRGGDRAARHAVQPGRPRSARPPRRATAWSVHDPHRHRRPAAPQQRRHRPDHPGGLPQAGHPHRLRGRPVRRLAQGRDLRPQQPRVCRGLGPRGRPRLRHRLLARARRLGADELRLPGRHLARGSPTSSAATAASRAC